MTRTISFLVCRILASQLKAVLESGSGKRRSGLGHAKKKERKKKKEKGEYEKGGRMVIWQVYRRIALFISINL